DSEDRKTKRGVVAVEPDSSETPALVETQEPVAPAPAGEPAFVQPAHEPVPPQDYAQPGHDHVPPGYVPPGYEQMPPPGHMPAAPSIPTATAREIPGPVTGSIELETLSGRFIWISLWRAFRLQIHTNEVLSDE